MVKCIQRSPYLFLHAPIRYNHIAQRRFPFIRIIPWKLVDFLNSLAFNCTFSFRGRRTTETKKIPAQQSPAPPEFDRASHLFRETLCSFCRFLATHLSIPCHGFSAPSYLSLSGLISPRVLGSDLPFLRAPAISRDVPSSWLPRYSAHPECLFLSQSCYEYLATVGAPYARS